jgi:hypothetical protein
MGWVRCAIALSLAAWSAAAIPAVDPDWMPSESLVREIDAQIQLPEGAFPRAEYARYYAPFARNDLQSLVAVFIHDPRRPGTQAARHCLQRPRMTARSFD